MKKKLAVILFLLCLAGCASSRMTVNSVANPENVPWQALSKNGITIEYQHPDERLISDLLQQVVAGEHAVTEFFGSPFPKSYKVRIFSSRAEMDDFWSRTVERPVASANCWMIASATAELLYILSPRIWLTEACANNPDRESIQNTINHELVHVYHAQLNPNKLWNMKGRTWFIEGLAVHASKQLTARNWASLKSIANSDARPKGLGDFWGATKKNSYSLSGSLIEYIDKTFGRDVIVQMLSKTTKEELLDASGMSEASLTQGWQSYVMRRPDAQ